MPAVGKSSYVLSYSNGLISINTTTAGMFYLQFYLELAKYAGVKTNTLNLFVNVSATPVNTAPYFSIAPSSSYTIYAGVAQELLLEVLDRESNDFTITIDFGDLADFAKQST